MTKQLAGLIVLFLLGKITEGQPVTGKLQFEKGKTLNIQMEMKSSVTQQAMNQAIDFTADAAVVHFYKVLNADAGNTTLHHEIKKIGFNFDGMGQKRSFDSDKTQDMQGPLGDPVKNILSKKFEMVIDPYGKALAIKPEKTDSIQTDERLAIVFTMLKDITDVVYPPNKGEPSFFKILPATEIIKGESWVDSLQNANGKFSTSYTVTDITDSLIVVDFKGKSNTVNKAMMMGRETITTLNSEHIGKIILDRTTGIIKQKNIITESGGTTEAMGGTVPVTSKTTITIYVKPE